MGIHYVLFLAVLDLICIGLDITIFFLVCRIVLLRWKTPCLEKLNDVGKGLVDMLSGYTGRLWHRATQNHLSVKGELIISLIALLFVRTALSTVGGLVLNLRYVNMKATAMNKCGAESQTSNEIHAHLRQLGQEGFGVTELRTFDPVPMVAYADNEDDFVGLCLEMEGKTTGIYVGVQPRPLWLFDKAPNCWRSAHSGPGRSCACDKDIEYVTAAFWDIDAESIERTKDHRASEQELLQSLRAAQLLCREDGLALCATICCSGNGHYVLVSIVPIPVDSDEVALKFKGLCQQLVGEIAGRVTGVRLDPVFNLSRVMRVMGTTNRKGQPAPGRPHRRAHFVTEPAFARSVALHHMILNTEADKPHNVAGPVPKGLHCNLRKLEDCEFIAWCRAYPDHVSEPAWWAMITNLAYLEGGIQLIHEISRLDKYRYDYANTQRVIQRVMDAGYKPVSCTTIASETTTCAGQSKFQCSRIDYCPAKAPMYMASLRTVCERQEI